MSIDPDRHRRFKTPYPVPAGCVCVRLFAALAVTALTLACTAAESTLSGPSATKCQVAVANSIDTVPAAGAAGTLTVTTARDCSWAASGGAAWLVFTSSSNGLGEGTIGYRAAANTEPVARRATVEVNNVAVTIAQDAAACRFTASPLTHNVGAGGGSVTVHVETHASCPWNATTNADWITIASGTAGAGNGAVGLTIAPNSGPHRNAVVQVAGASVAIAQADGSPAAPPPPVQPTPPSCTYAIQPTGQTIAAGGGPGTVTVTAGPTCGWSATSNVGWISVTSGSTGTGNGSVAFSVAANNGGSRTGTLSIAGHAFTLTQAGVSCNYSINPSSDSQPAAGGTSTVSVMTNASCAWTSASNASWITIPSGASQTGPGSVTLGIGANTAAARTGTATIAGQTFTVSQSAAPCTFSIAPSTLDFPAAGGNGSTAVTAGGGCAWTASTTFSWITITEGASGVGSGTVKFTVSSNAAAARSGTITAGGQTLTVTQQAASCTFGIAPTSQNFSASGGSASVAVTAGATCGWTAASNNTDWLTITGNAAGTGNGSVGFSVAAHTGAARTGTLNIAGQTFTVTQDAPCTFSISPTNQNVGASGGSGTITVTTGASCSWTAASNNPDWLTITAGGSGSGPGSVSFSAAANSGGSQRTGTLSIAGQTFTVSQD
jgi:hypothetical protein